MTPSLHLPVSSAAFRRRTRAVAVGKVGIGGDNPIRVQSMITCDTMDTEASIRQTMDLAAVGCEIVRITAPTVKDARNLEWIKRGLLERGCDVPIVADIHFKPDAALEAARWVEKVRVNPGNFADSKKFAVKEYTDEQYGAELERIRERFTPLVRLCQEGQVAIRIGTNHGSLSDRIMNRYGDTPLGMVESALEFARIARDCDFHDFIFSMKSSNPKVMIAAYRLLADRLDKEGSDWNYPLHLGVTEAGDGEDGRIKSAIGIGSLLNDGIGDTVRVSLTEDSVHEIPVARALVAQFGRPFASPESTHEPEPALSFDPFSYRRRAVVRMSVGRDGARRRRGAARGGPPGDLGQNRAQSSTGWATSSRSSSTKPRACARSIRAMPAPSRSSTPRRETASSRCAMTWTCRSSARTGCSRRGCRSGMASCSRIHLRRPAIRRRSSSARCSWRPRTSARCCATASAMPCSCKARKRPGQSLRLAYNILQAAGSRAFKTDYVACPSCGRTLFNLQDTTAKIRAATGHLKGVKIAIMGCIVNGPGEMADADFGYVGGAPSKVNLYVGKQPVKFNIPETEAVARLTDLIREHGRWIEAPASSSAVPVAESV